jgi:hypothetical protein
MRERVQLEDPDDDRFTTYLFELRHSIENRAPEGGRSRFEVLGLLAKSHLATNDVRHRFAPLAIEEARQATQHLVMFCTLVGIRQTDALKKVEEYLDAWNDRRPIGELSKTLNEAGFRLQLEKNVAKRLTERLSQLEAVEKEREGLKTQRRQLEDQIRQLEAVSQGRDSKIDELRGERAKLLGELKIAKQRVESLKDAQDYVDALTRMTVYTRTRADYERSITKLTSEQKKALERISLNEDFLIKGAAGTGKSLVLLKAIEKAREGEGNQNGLGLDELRGTVALLTYTTTLAKYDQYIESIMAKGVSGSRVSTASAFLLERLHEIEPSARIENDLPDQLARRFPVAGLSTKDLSAEVEDFIWGNDLSYEEYVLEGMERRGMKRPLGREQREAVWRAAEAMIADMEGQHSYTWNRAAVLLVRALTGEGGSGVTLWDFLFIDEAQDLSAAMLKALKACSKRCVILAGDADQAIYQPGFSFRRAGLDIAGRTKILHTNFRNTIQVHALAERYRSKGIGIDEDSQPEAFREGPEPELFEAAGLDAMLELLIKRLELFINVLGYAPENICIMSLRDKDLEDIAQRLSSEGLSLVDVRDRGFAFSESGSVRLSTMHSAKGLDFPVVLLFILQFNLAASSFDTSAVDRMTRNLIYVSMTRAMDHLNVFLPEATEEKALVDLAACFDGTEMDKA